MPARPRDVEKLKRQAGQIAWRKTDSSVKVTEQVMLTLRHKADAGQHHFREMLLAVNRLDRMTVAKLITNPQRAIQLHAEMTKAIRRVHKSGDDVLPVDAAERMARVQRQLCRIRKRADRAYSKFFILDPMRKMLGPYIRNIQTARAQLRKEIRAELDRREGDREIHPPEVAKAVHARLRPDVEISLGYISRMTWAICRARYLR